jgi:hypothetical protein
MTKQRLNGVQQIGQVIFSVICYDLFTPQQNAY